MSELLKILRGSEDRFLVESDETGGDNSDETSCTEVHVNR